MHDIIRILDHHINTTMQRIFLVAMMLLCVDRHCLDYLTNVIQVRQQHFKSVWIMVLIALSNKKGSGKSTHMHRFTQSKQGFTPNAD